MKVRMLRYDMMEAAISHNEKRHPQSVLKGIGVDYFMAVPQSISDCWFFYLPEFSYDFMLPKFCEVMMVDPLDHVGFGLSMDDAKLLICKTKEIDKC